MAHRHTWRPEFDPGNHERGRRRDDFHMDCGTHLTPLPPHTYILIHTHFKRKTAIGSKFMNFLAVIHYLS